MDEKRIALSRATVSTKDLKVPSSPGISYRDFQLVAIEYALSPPYRALIADDMGLGKTVEAIGVINHLSRREVYLGERFLVICPAYLKLNWKAELEKWLVRPFSVGVVSSRQVFPGTGVVVINYDILHLFKKELDAVAWGVMVLDESHRLQSKDSRRTVMVYGGVLTEKTEEVKDASIERPNVVGGRVYSSCSSSVYGNFSSPREVGKCVGEQTVQPFYSENKEKQKTEEVKDGVGTDNDDSPSHVTGRVLRVHDRVEQRDVGADESDACLRGSRARTTFRKVKYKSIQAFAVLNLTGTPAYNRPVNLWTQLHALRPDIFPDFFAFVKRYCDAKKKPFGWDFTGASNLEELNRKMRSSCMVRRLLKDVESQLPQVVETWLPFTLSRVKKGLKPEGVKGELVFEELAKYRVLTGLAKVPFVKNVVKGLLESSEKIIVFAYHREVVAKLYKIFAAQAVFIVGGESPAAQEGKIQRFKNEKSLLIGTMDSIGEGLNLQFCNTAVFAELDWSSEKLRQAVARLVRIGQRNTVKIYFTKLIDSLDELMSGVAFNKRGNIKSLLGD